MKPAGLTKFASKADLIEAKAQALHRTNLETGGVFNEMGERISDIERERAYAQSFVLMAKKGEMDNVQLALIARVLRSKEPAITAAGIVLVQGKTVSAAVAATGMLQPSVSRTVKRFRELHQEFKDAYKNL